MVKLKYFDRHSIAAPVGVSGGTVYRGNSIFDPWEPTGGHQPYGHDEYAQLYSQYVVHACKVVVRFVPDRTSVETAGVLGIFPSSASVLPNNPEELPRTKLKGMNKWGNGVQTLSYFMKTKKILNLATVRDNTDVGAVFGANPAKQWYWHIFTGVVQGTDTLDCSIMVKLTYYVEMRIPLMVGAS